MGAPIRVLLADDHAAMRIGLATFLETYDDLQLVGQASNGAEALDLCASLQPDVVLMDLNMPEVNGVEATRSISQQHPQVKVIALTSFKEEALVQGAIQAGAIGYLLKDIQPDDLARAIRGAAAGEPALAPIAAQALIQASRQAAAPQHEALTDREREVLALMRDGLNNVEIGQRLYVSRSTVKTHVSSILGKLGVSTRVEAVARAVQMHLV